MNNCYICLQATEDKSPCKCQSTIHKTCLQQWMTHSSNKNIHKCCICTGYVLVPIVQYYLFLIRILYSVQVCTVSCYLLMTINPHAYLKTGTVVLFATVMCMNLSIKCLRIKMNIKEE